MNEFDLIDTYFRPLAEGRAEAQGFANDAAVLSVPDGFDLVVTSDSAIAGVHFLPDQPAETIAKKALRRNVSDLAAMGARPFCYQLCLCLPDEGPAGGEAWFRAFVSGLAADQAQYGIFLSGGDTASTPGPLSISVTAMGLAERGKALARDGARDGDLVVLTGVIGDAYCGLQALRQGMDAPDLARAYRVPEPPVALAADVAGFARAGIDVSDGLVADLGHICRASGLAAVIDADAMMFSPAVRGWLEEGRVSLADVLSGGDDYQLVMAVAPENLDGFRVVAEGKGVPLQVIGRFQAGQPGVTVRCGGQVIPLQKTGWTHF